MTCQKPPYTQQRAYYLKRRREREDPGLRGTLRVYYCPRCGHHHLTSTPDRFRKEKAS